MIEYNGEWRDTIGRQKDITDMLLNVHRDATVKDLEKIMDKKVATGNIVIPRQLAPKLNFGTYKREI